MRFAFIGAQKASFPITVLCEVLQVSESGFHAWAKRPESTRAKQDRCLTVHIKAKFARSRKSYGSPRMTDDLKDSGTKVGRHRVARLMREAGIVGRPPRRFKKTTDSKHKLPIAPNLVARRWDDVATAPDKLWVTDITYVWTWQGWAYLCVYLDVFSRKIVGWSFDETMETRLVTDALKSAIARRNPTAGLMTHSDQGSQYASHAYRDLLTAHQFVQSMSRKGDCWDNALAESFFATIKAELIDRRSWVTRAQVKEAIGEWIEVFYNGQRRHSSLGNVSPADYERLTRESQAA